MTFKVCNFGSNYPIFNRAYVVRGCLFSATTVVGECRLLLSTVCLHCTGLVTADKATVSARFIDNLLLRTLANVVYAQNTENYLLPLLLMPKLCWKVAFDGVCNQALMGNRHVQYIGGPPIM